MARMVEQAGEDSGAVSGVSVGELVRRRMGREPDPWNLALVQRDEVWDPVRMRQLLDSLLAGYPIGAILLCRVAESSQVLARNGGARQAVDADRAHWQLLDGQQRINALFSILTAEGEYGRFFLDLLAPRPEPGPVTRRSSKERHLAHLPWDSGPSDEGGDDVFLRQPWHLDLSRWLDWAESDRFKSAVNETNVCEVVLEIDPDCSANFDGEQARVAAYRVAQIARAWSSPTIPVLATEVATPMDVLEVFTRINMGGVQVSGLDVYFAAVKTFWPNAEACLDRVAATSDFLDRMSALRLISRLASRGLNQGDILPMVVDRLTGERGRLLISAMEELSSEASPILRRLEEFDRVIADESMLGMGLKFVDHLLWDEPLAWAAAHELGSAEIYRASLSEVDGYLMGASLFDYRGVLGDAFRRSAMLESLAAATGGERFPLERIRSVAEAAGLSRVRKVRGLSDLADQTALANSRKALILGIAQRLPYSQTYVDIDHIYPSALGSAELRVVSPTSGRLVHHKQRGRLNWLGNFWMLDASTNRALQATPPKAKFQRLTAGDFAVWPRDQWGIDETEQVGFEDIEELLADQANREAGGNAFGTLVEARGQRLLKQAIVNVPAAALFAADSGSDPEDPSAIDAADVAHAIGLSDSLLDSLRPKPMPIDGKPAKSDLPGAWFGRDEELQWVVSEATKAHRPADQARSLPGGRGDGFDFRRYVRIGAPERQTHLAVGIVSAFERDTGKLFWAHLRSATPGFEEAVERLESAGVTARHDLGHFWVPLTCSSELRWSCLAEQLTDCVSHLRSLVSQP